VDTFWLVVAGLVVFITGIILLVFLPWLSRSKNNTSGVALVLSEGRAKAIIVSIAILLFCIFFYLAWSKPDRSTSLQQERMPNTAIAPEHVKAIDELAVRLKQNPEDGKGWAMLARTYAVTGRYKEAVEAYEKAVSLVKNDAVMLIDYADVLAMVNGKNMQGKPLELVHHALELDPGNIKGLALMGTASFQTGDYKQAEKYWREVLTKLPQDSQMSKQINAGIADAQKMTSGNKDQQNQFGAVIAGVAKLSSALSGKVAPSDTVFVFAKSISGSPMPIVVMRGKVRDLPIRFVLNDSMAMMPSMKLSNHDYVTVSAKISKSGSATPQRGDLKGETTPVKVGASNILVVIDSVVP